MEDEWQVPNLTESVSVAEDVAVHITLTNLSLDKDYEIRTILTDYQVNEVKGEIVHGEMHEMNTFRCIKERISVILVNLTWLKSRASRRFRRQTKYRRIRL